MIKLRLLSLLILSMAANTIFAQEIKLTTNYPQPRAGQHFTVSFDMSFFNDFFTEAMGGALHVGEVGHFEKTYARSLVASQPGNYEIGPFNFNFNGKTYTTNKLNITVAEPLPPGEGVWLRHVRNGQEELLIVEQKMKMNTPRSPNQRTPGTAAGQQEGFASLIENSVEGLKFKKGFASKGQVPDGKGFNFNHSMNYSLQIYTIQRDESFRGNTTVEKHHFKNLPQNIQFSPVTLN